MHENPRTVTISATTNLSLLDFDRQNFAYLTICEDEEQTCLQPMIRNDARALADIGRTGRKWFLDGSRLSKSRNPHESKVMVVTRLRCTALLADKPGADAHWLAENSIDDFMWEFHWVVRK